MRRVNYFIYGAAGVMGIAVGAARFVIGGRESASHDELHLMQELGAAGVFAGLMSFWCILNYARRRGVHYALTVFTLLIAFIHWKDFANGYLPLISPVFNSVPAAILVLMLWSLRDGEDVEQGKSERIGLP